jgi:hypothetical protein
VPRLLIAVALALLATNLTAAEKPNVVLIVLDDAGQRDFGCYGSTYHKTPHLDALAKQSVRFTEATSSGAWPPLAARPEHRLVGPKLTFPQNGPLVKPLFAAGYTNINLSESKAVEFLGASPKTPFALGLETTRSDPVRPETVAKYKLGKPGTQGNPANAAQLEALDDSVGLLLKALDDAKLTETTIVVVASTGGGVCTLDGMPQPPTFNGPFREGKGWLYEGGLRVPLLIRAPGFKPAVVAGAVDGIDLLPTLLDLCSLKADAKEFDGVSLAKVLHGDTLPPRSLVHFFPHYSREGGKPGVAIRRDNWKLLVDFETDRGELYDLKADPGEGRNVAAENAKLVKELRDEIDAWIKSRGAKLPTPNPDYRPNPPDKDGVITMHARTATVSGRQLRYEPLPHKNTLGYWVHVEDTAAFDFTATMPGAYTVEVLQGCGKGSGGSEVELSVGVSKLTFTVKDTGGFQAFERRAVGTLTVAAGRQTLTVKPLTKPGAAVMDLREVVLRPAK